uniref:flagellin N-terminal helical domain-containing protein n=1 Tax=Acetatifactor sp. TaxID=1872090 RepID=UPI0040564888
MRINYNVSAMLSNNALANNDSLLAKSLQRLSSGLKINQAKDGPAGLAMAKRMNAQIEGISVANQNAGDGVSIIEIADGALTEVSDMLQRMNELAIKSANGTMTEEDREIIQAEVTQLKTEIARVSETTEFNGQKLLDGEFSLKGYTTTLGVSVNNYSAEVPVQSYTINELNITKTVVNGHDAFEVDYDGFQGGAGFPANTEVESRDGLITFKAESGFELTIDVTDAEFTNDKLSLKDTQIDVTGIGPMRLQIGANEGQIMEVDIPAMNLRNMGIEYVDVSTDAGATEAIDRIKGAINYVSSVRGKLGAYQNRLESTTNSLDVTTENMTAAYSRIMDVDMAEEMTQYTTYQVLTQAGTSMLAQANERPSQVLQLLQ